jgi:putative ATPase
LQGAMVELPELLAVRGEPDLRFDAIVGRSTLTTGSRTVGAATAPPADKGTAIGLLAGLLRPEGTLSLAEAVPRHAQRLYALADVTSLPVELARRLVEAEEAIYHTADDPLVNWSEVDLTAACAAAGLSSLTVTIEESSPEVQIRPAMLARWFSAAPAGERPSYAQRLAALLDSEERAQIEALYRRQLLGRAVPWRSVTAYLVARAPA